MKSFCKKCRGGEVVFLKHGRLCLKCLGKKLGRPSLTICAVQLLEAMRARDNEKPSSPEFRRL